MESKTLTPLVLTKNPDSFKYNSFIHGTHSSILALLPHTEFTILSPIEMISHYQIAPITGEITKGGLRDLSAESKSAFGQLQLNDTNHYTLEKIIRNYAIPKPIDLANKAKLIEDVQREFQRLFRCSFSNINILLIYLARAKQAGITNRELISETQEADIIARMQATIQFHYLILLFGDKINPDYGWLEDVSEAQKKEILYAVSTHLSFHAITEKLVSNPIDMQSLYENPECDPLTLAAVTELLELPQESDISICYSRFNMFYVDKRVSLEKTVIFSSQSANDAERFLSEEAYMEVWGDDDIPSAQKVIDHVLDADYHQTIDNFLRYFAAKKLPKRFFTELKSLALNQIQVCSHRFGLLRNLLDKEPSNVLDRRYEHLITHGFPLILICENDENMTLISESTREYRAQYPLRLGENITMIATDSMAHQDILLNYLRENNLTGISVVSFDQLKESKWCGIRPVGRDITVPVSSATECKEAESTPDHHGLSVEEIPANVAPLISSENSYQPRIFKVLSSHRSEREQTQTAAYCLVS